MFILGPLGKLCARGARRYRSLVRSPSALNDFLRTPLRGAWPLAPEEGGEEEDDRWTLRVALPQGSPGGEPGRAAGRKKGELASVWHAGG